VAAGERSPAHVLGALAPDLQHVVFLRDEAFFAPERQQRAADPAPKVGLVVGEVGRRGGAVVLAGRVNALWARKAALVLGQSSRSEGRLVAAPLAQLGPQVVGRVGADQALGQVVGLAEKEPVVVGVAEGLVGCSERRASAAPLAGV